MAEVNPAHLTAARALWRRHGAVNFDLVAQAIADAEARGAATAEDRIRALESELAEQRKREEDVRTLDEWADAEGGRTWQVDGPDVVLTWVKDEATEEDPDAEVECHKIFSTSQFLVNEARAAAAAYVRSLPPQPEPEHRDDGE